MTADADEEHVWGSGRVWVLMAGPDPNGQGGMATVARLPLRYGREVVELR